MQAWSSLFRWKKEEKYAAFVFEMADWALSRQIKDGSFLVDYAKDGPSFHTACVLEGIADALSIAGSMGDESRICAYAAAWDAGACDLCAGLWCCQACTYALTGPEWQRSGILKEPV